MHRRNDAISTLETQLADAKESLRRAERKIKDMGVENGGILLDAFRLTVLEATDERVCLATDEAPGITHFMIERSQFTAEFEIRLGSVMIVKISAILVPPSAPSKHQEENLRKEMAKIAEDLERNSISGPVEL